MQRLLAFALVVSACSGDTGPAGPGGPPGPSGDPGGDRGTVSGTVYGEDGTPIELASVALSPGNATASTTADGAFSIPDLGIGVYTVEVSATGFVSQTVSNVSIVVDTTTEIDVVLALPPDTTAAVHGTLRRHTDDPDSAVAGATIELVDAFTLDASALDAPLEPLAAASPYRTTTGADGSFAIDDVAPGRYFIHATPAPADGEALLPGGDASRASFGLAEGDDRAVDITLSQRPSPAATYVGTSVCLLCHDGEVATDASGWKRTLHAVVYRVPDAPTAIQDLSQLPGHDAALAYFKDGNPRDNTGAADQIGLRISNAAFPKFPTAYDLLLGYDTRYFMQFATAGRTSAKYYVEFTFGGSGVYKERWVTRVSTDGSYDPTPGGDSSYYILPVQYDEGMPAGIEPFHPYNAANWAGPAVAGGPAVRPAQSKSFDNNCAGCHFTGTKLSADPQGNFHAAAADVPLGTLDYDGNGADDEMDIGCEACHGPGSDHIGGGVGVGTRIIAPRYLSAERSSAICGACHTRTEGMGTIAGIHTEFPSLGVDTLTFPEPGMPYAELAAYFTEVPGLFMDDSRHSRQHHQQYYDLRKSKHNKNPYHAVACDDCHDLHDRSIGPSLSERVDNNDMCLGCHAYPTFGLAGAWTAEQEAEAVSSHMTEYADMTVGYDPLNIAGDGAVGRCTTCHMPKTASSRSRWIHEGVDAAGQPAGPRIEGDIASHTFEVITPAESEAVYLNNATNNQLPNSCGGCHNAVLDVTPNYTW